MSEEDSLQEKTEKLNLNGGGGGGPKAKFSFKSAVGAAEFVPSWSMPASAPQQPVAYQGYSQNQQGYHQGYQQQQGGYQQQQGGYQQQQYYSQNQNQQYYAPPVQQQQQKPAAMPYFAPKSAASVPSPNVKSSPTTNTQSSSKDQAEKSSPKAPKQKPAAEKTTAPPKSAKAKTSAFAPAPASSGSVGADEPDEVFDMTNVVENVNVLFMGHVDAGKSTMGGHILLLTGMVDKRTMEKYEQEARELGRESWYLSWALDLNQEERDKGKTTEYGRGAFVTEKRHFTIIDAPGHRNYIPSMIEGAAQADIGILVISARKGEFETGFEKDGQTREHVLLAKTAGVKRIIMVINKMDDPTVQWDKARYDDILGKLMPFLKGVGYGSKDVDVMPISGFTGANMKEVLDPAVCDWWSGQPLLSLLDDIPLERKYNGPFLMPVADKTKDMGTIAMGKLESGHVKKGSQVLIMPTRKTAEVLAIFSDESEIQVAHNGDNIRLRLKGVDEEDLQPGFVLCQQKNPVHAVMQFEAQLQIVEYPSIMCAGYNSIMHAHTTREEVSIAEILHKIDKKTKRKSKAPPKFMKQGDVCIVRIECNRNVCLETYDDYPQLGRFTLRDEARTVAVGKVLKLITE